MKSSMSRPLRRLVILNRPSEEAKFYSPNRMANRFVPLSFKKPEYSVLQKLQNGSTNLQGQRKQAWNLEIRQE